MHDVRFDGTLELRPKDRRVRPWLDKVGGGATRNVPLHLFLTEEYTCYDLFILTRRYDLPARSMNKFPIRRPYFIGPDKLP